MIRLGGRTVLIGGFHDHWGRTNSDNPTLLMAAMNFYHYDFMCLMDGPGEARSKRIIESYCPWMRMYVGLEAICKWGHIINVHGHREVSLPSGADPREAFAAYNAAYEFVAMAHPPAEDRADGPLVLEEVGRLMDEGVIKATQLCLSPKDYEWFARREREGKVTPICSGWDVHLVNPLPGLPAALYTTGRAPAGHLDSGGSCRTLVFSERNDFATIKDAVLRGDSVIEDLFTGKLLGPSKLVAFLEQNRYRQEIARLDGRRDACTMAFGEKPTAGRQLAVKFSAPGKVCMPGTLEEPAESATDADGNLLTAPLPALMDRDRTYLPLVKYEEDGYARVWAIELHHPVQLDALPKIRFRGTTSSPSQADLAIELRPSAPFAGTFTLKVAGSDVEIAGDQAALEVSLPSGTAAPEPVDVELVGTSQGVTRRSRAMLTYYAAQTFDGNWSSVPAYDIAENCMPRQAFGSTRPYPGRDVFSAKLQFAWTGQEFLVRTRVTDPVHYQVLRGHYMYNGDSLQLGVDPLLRRQEGKGGIYVFNYCLTPEGPELFRWLRPDAGLAPGYRPEPENVTMGSRYLRVSKWDKGLMYDLCLPWSELAPVCPAAGIRMGLYHILFNNNGQGLVDSLHWPRPLDGMWLVPRRWGVLTLV